MPLGRMRLLHQGHPLRAGQDGESRRGRTVVKGVLARAWPGCPLSGMYAVRAVRCRGKRAFEDLSDDPSGKRAMTDLPPAGFDLLPDDWHLKTSIM